MKVDDRTRRSYPIATVLGVLIALAIGAAVFLKFMPLPGRPQPSAPAAAEVDRGTVTPAPAAFQCDGRTHCSQMTSCAEAKYFLAHCPGVKMDGNDDGVPCEQQWCTSPLAR